MRNKIYLEKKILHIICIILLFMSFYSIIDYIEYKSYIKTFNQKINTITIKLKEKYPNIKETEIIEILKLDEKNNSILSKYGYDINKDSVLEQNDEIKKINTCIKIILTIMLIITIYIVMIKHSQKKDKELNKIIECIEQINKRNYELNIEEISEEKTSILKQEIYKTTIMLKEQAENSLKDKKNLKTSLQDISHQLKTPLTTINILLDNIIDNPNMDEETKNEFIKKIKRETTNISFLIKNLLKLSKFESNTINYIKEEIEVKTLIEETIKNIESICDLRNIDIITNYNNVKKIKCDYRWQIEALTNILKNAIEYSHNNSKIKIECIEKKLYIQIDIKDYGMGMDKEECKNIFKRFYNGNKNIKDSIGIGLELSKKIIEKENGTIFVKSEKNKGTTFTIKYYK